MDKVGNAEDKMNCNICKNEIIIIKKQYFINKIEVCRKCFKKEVNWKPKWKILEDNEDNE